jgi:mannose-1-phosphate guanylyltransferase / mannose-6-phosphate isomerase
MSSTNKFPVLPVILCGGSGTRLWPLSRESHPKQFHSFIGERSLLENTAIRAAAIDDAREIVLICNEQHRFAAAEQASAFTTKSIRTVLEPCARNTAAAIAAIAELYLEQDPVLVVLPSDHHLPDIVGFRRAISRAASVAELGYLVTFGVRPTSAETGYGYIEAGERLSMNGAFKVSRFVEKPNALLAAELIKNERYTWNSGMFVMKASVYLEELSKYSPDVRNTVREAVNVAVHETDFIRLQRDSFERSPNISVDYAVFERSDKVATVSFDGTWSDLGSWAAVAELALQQKPEDHAPLQNVIEVNAKDNYVHANKPVALVGVEGLVVVDTDDALLITGRDSAQYVKDAVSIIKERAPALASLHRKVNRPWGWYDSVDISSGHQVKRIMVKPGASLSLQSHNHRAEHWIIVKGTASVTVDSVTKDYTQNEHVYIPLKARHRLENHTNSTVEIVEVQCGDYLGEDDIIRYEDIYGRV